MLPVLLGLGGAGISAISEMGRQKDLERHNKGQAEMTKYSPWTGVSGQIQQDQGPGVLGAAVGGGMSGAMMGMNAQSMFNQAPGMTPEAVTAGIDANAAQAAPMAMNMRQPQRSPWMNMNPQMMRS